MRLNKAYTLQQLQQHRSFTKLLTVLFRSIVLP